MFHNIVEMHSREKWLVHTDVANSVDALLAGKSARAQLREYLNGKSSSKCTLHRSRRLSAAMPTAGFRISTGFSKLRSSQKMIEKPLQLASGHGCGQLDCMLLLAEHRNTSSCNIGIAIDVVLLS